MNKTTKQIADELQVSKQQVYRFIKKNCIKEALQQNGTMYYDETAQELIKQGFKQNEAHHEAVHETHQKHFGSTSTAAGHHDLNTELIEMLKQQLEVKDQQIAELNKALDQQQQLNMKTLGELEQVRGENQLLLEQKETLEEKKKRWKFF